MKKVERFHIKIITEKTAAVNVVIKPFKVSAAVLQSIEKKYIVKTGFDYDSPFSAEEYRI